MVSKTGGVEKIALWKRIAAVVLVGCFLILNTPRLLADEPANQKPRFVNVASPTEGIVKTVAVKVGQCVKLGTVLLTLDDTDARDALEEAKVALEISKREVLVAKFSHETAATLLERAMKAFQQGGLWQEELLVRKNEARRTQEELKKAKLAIKLREIVLRKAQRQVDRCRIISPSA